MISNLSRDSMTSYTSDGLIVTGGVMNNDKDKLKKELLVMSENESIIEFGMNVQIAICVTKGAPADDVIVALARTLNHDFFNAFRPAILEAVHEEIERRK